MRHSAVILALAALPSLAANAGAQDTERYQLEKTDSGYVRLNTATGEMSICEERGDQLICRVAADERSALQDDVDRLGDTVRALEDRVAALERAPAISALPSEEQIDQTMTLMQRFLRGFMDTMKELDEEEGTSTSPQKT
jgi:hypothetical protein